MSTYNINNLLITFTDVYKNADASKVFDPCITLLSSLNITNYLMDKQTAG